MGKGFLYVRGLGGSLFWGAEKNAGVFSRRGLQQIDLGRISEVPPRTQAVVQAGKCAKCGTVSFKAFP
jgi:hypothetical protein